MNMKSLTETSTFRVLSLLLCLCFFIPAMNVSLPVCKQTSLKFPVL